VKAGASARIVRKRLNSVPGVISFEAVPDAGATEPAGTVEIRGSRWIFPKPPVIVPLARHNRVGKGFWDTFFTVEVCPDDDVTVRVGGTGVPAILWVAAGFVVAAAAAVLVLTVVL